MTGRVFRLLAADALRDALRRRLAFVVVAVALLGVATAESCTSFGRSSWTWNGQTLDPELMAGWIAPFLYGFEALAFVMLAGLLAADQLARPLRDGSAGLWLARPVGRGTYACARLAGALGVAFLAGGLLLGATAALLVGRHDLALGPAVLGAIAGALSATTVGALATLASLVVGRVAVVALVGMFVPMVALANALAAAGAELGGFLGLLDRFAPPLGRALLAAVAAWNPRVPAEALDPTAYVGVLALWTLASVAALVLAFRRLELPR